MIIFWSQMILNLFYLGFEAKTTTFAVDKAKNLLGHTNFKNYVLNFYLLITSNFKINNI